MKTMLSTLKRRLRKRNKSGFTLIEVIIAMSLLGLLVTGVITFISPVMQMVQNNKKNARATMLAEAINTYITGNIKSAKIVETFAGQNLDDVMTNGASTFSSDALNITTLFTPGTYADENEIRCMGMVWMDDNSSNGGGRKKLMLVNCRVDNDLKITSYEPVFDDALYSELYPIIHIDSVDSESGGKANGYEVVTEVYVTPRCYNVISPDARNIGANFTGTTYIQCVNLSAAYSKVGQTYPTFTTGSEEERQQGSIDHWYDWGTGSNGFTDGTNNYFYTDTFIYYVVPRK